MCLVELLLDGRMAVEVGNHFSKGRSSVQEIERLNESALNSKHWKWSILSAFADFLDAGGTVATGASMVLWVSYFHLTATLVGVIGMLGAHGVSTAVGAFVGGRLGDRYGRKYIYSFDLLVYCLGTLVVIFSFSFPVLLIGSIIMGLAIGADVPTSWSLIAEIAPQRHRGRLMGLTNVFWYIGPIVILVLLLLFGQLGIWGVRLVFACLFIVALITWYLRKDITESVRWQVSVGNQKTHDIKKQLSFKRLFQRRFLKSMAFILPVYVCWGIPAGTYGFFLPYIFSSVGAASKGMSYMLEIAWFLSAIITVVFVYMPLNDRVDRRILYAISAAICAASFYLLVFAPISNPVVAFSNVLLFGFGQGIGLWPLQRVWSVELFPTELRNTGQAFVWSIMRLTLGVWSFYLPVITHGTGMTIIAAILAIMFTFNMIVGGLFGPKTAGRSLEEIHPDELAV